MVGKRKHTKAEIENDRSLLYCPYRRLELVWADTLNGPVRFIEYVGEMVRIADRDSCRILDKLVPWNTIRRPSTMSQESRKITDESPINSYHPALRQRS